MDTLIEGIWSATSEPARIRVVINSNGEAVLMVNDGLDVTLVTLTTEQRFALIAALSNGSKS